MRHFQREGVQPESALVALRESYTNPDLTQFVRSFIGPYPPTRKEDMLAVLVPLVEGEGLVRTWEKRLSSKPRSPRPRGRKRGYSIGTVLRLFGRSR